MAKVSQLVRVVGRVPLPLNPGSGECGRLRDQGTARELVDKCGRGSRESVIGIYKVLGECSPDLSRTGAAYPVHCGGSGAGVGLPPYVPQL